MIVVQRWMLRQLAEVLQGTERRTLDREGGGEVFLEEKTLEFS